MPGDHDSLDVSLHDCQLLEEVTLLTDVMIAASDAEEPLTIQQIDDLLQVQSRR
jgi:hypothetical protein